MDHFIIRTGDMLQVTVPPPCVVPMLMAPIPLMGTSTSLTAAAMAACLEGDETPPVLQSPMPYMSPPFVTPGMVQATVQLLPTNKTMTTQNGKAILLKGSTFTVKLQVQAPAMQPTPAGPVPDPMPQYVATAQFITTNMTVKAGVNFARDFVAQQTGDRPAVIEDGGSTWTFAELVDASGRLAGRLVDHGVTRGDVVLSMQGNGIDNVLLTLACLHVGAAILPCSEQLRAKDLQLRLRRAQPALVVAAERDRAEIAKAAPTCPVLTAGPALYVGGDVPAYAELEDTDPSFVLFTSGTSGEPKLVTHGQRYVWGQRLQATEWMAAQPGEIVWSTAAPGWSKSARNCFVAPWWCGATAVVQDRRFDAAERLDTVRRLGVNVLCMAPTEYRLIAAHGPIGPMSTLRRIITAGEALGVPAWNAWREQTGLALADGYGQTETGQVTGVRPGEIAPPGSMGRPLPGVSVEIVDGELTVDPATLPAFFLGYEGEPAPPGQWHTGDQVRQDDEGWLFFQARADDVIISAGYRIGPAEVESTLLGHPAVRECAVLAVPDAARGAVVGAAVVLRDGITGSPELIAEVQAHVRADTAPYKYPRRIWFVDELPKTTSGKVVRSQIVVPSD